MNRKLKNQRMHSVRFKQKLENSKAKIEAPTKQKQKKKCQEIRGNTYVNVGESRRSLGFLRDCERLNHRNRERERERQSGVEV